MGFAQSKKYDVEAWAPGMQRWLEGLARAFGDFQAWHIPWPACGSGPGRPRVLYVILLETYQQAERPTAPTKSCPLDPQHLEALLLSLERADVATCLLVASAGCWPNASSSSCCPLTLSFAAARPLGRLLSSRWFSTAAIPKCVPLSSCGLCSAWPRLAGGALHASSWPGRDHGSARLAAESSPPLHLHRSFVGSRCGRDLCADQDGAYVISGSGDTAHAATAPNPATGRCCLPWRSARPSPSRRRVAATIPLLGSAARRRVPELRTAASRCSATALVGHQHPHRLRPRVDRSRRNLLDHASSWRHTTP